MSPGRPPAQTQSPASSARGLAPVTRLALGLALSLVLGLALAAGPAPAAPLTLSLPQPATQTAAAPGTPGELLLPSGPFAAGALPGQYLTGRVSRSAWRIGQPLATVDLMTRLREDVLAAGFAVTFECQTAGCGGFDFRFALPILPEPDMHVDLGDFRFLAARRGEDGLTLMVSRSAQAAFVQIDMVGAQVAAPAAMGQATATVGADASTGAVDGGAGAVQPPGPTGIGEALMTQGWAILADLKFDLGQADLQPGPYGSLTALAQWLADHPDAQVALVGHTDATGALLGNIALSRARAEAVRQALIDLGVAAGRMSSEGAGWLAPRASNLTEAGRQENRRVEVVLTSTQLPSATSTP